MTTQSQVEIEVEVEEEVKKKIPFKPIHKHTKNTLLWRNRGQGNLFQ